MSKVRKIAITVGYSLVYLISLNQVAVYRVMPDKHLMIATSNLAFYLAVLFIGAGLAFVRGAARNAMLPVRQQIDFAAVAALSTIACGAAMKMLLWSKEGGAQALVPGATFVTLALGVAAVFLATLFVKEIATLPRPIAWNERHWKVFAVAPVVIWLSATVALRTPKPRAARVETSTQSSHVDAKWPETWNESRRKAYAKTDGKKPSFGKSSTDLMMLFTGGVEVSDKPAVKDESEARAGGCDLADAAELVVTSDDHYDLIATAAYADENFLSALIADDSGRSLYLRSRLLRLGITTTGDATRDGEGQETLMDSAAQKGFGPAEYRVAGRKVRRSRATSGKVAATDVKAFETAAERGSAEAALLLGAIAASPEDPVRAALRVINYDQLSIPPALFGSEARTWYCRAARAGHVVAARECAFHRANADDDTLDETDALSNLQAAARRGSITAMLYLGAMYANGIKVPKDPGQAKRFYCAVIYGGRYSRSLLTRGRPGPKFR